jgi:hypothetical protein
VGSDGKAKRFRASIVDLARESYSPSAGAINNDIPGDVKGFARRILGRLSVSWNRRAYSWRA